MSREKRAIDVKGIMKYLPHRYPFLLIDKVEDYEPHEWLRAVKNVSFNEPQFTGHFPSDPIMPGVMIVEAMAQATGVLGFASMGEEAAEGKLYILAGVDKARFRRMVVPGDQLVIDVKLLKVKRNIWKFECQATVDGELAASAIIMCTETKAS